MRSGDAPRDGAGGRRVWRRAAAATVRTMPAIHLRRSRRPAAARSAPLGVVASRVELPSRALGTTMINGAARRGIVAHSPAILPVDRRRARD
jgi:hypothetical protein